MRSWKLHRAKPRDASLQLKMRFAASAAARMSLSSSKLLKFHGPTASEWLQFAASCALCVNSALLKKKKLKKENRLSSPKLSCSQTLALCTTHYSHSQPEWSICISESKERRDGRKQRSIITKKKERATAHWWGAGVPGCVFVVKKKQPPWNTSRKEKKGGGHSYYMQDS